MGKKREATERRKDRGQAEGAKLERARQVATKLGVALPTAIPSKYTRRGRKVSALISALATS